MQSAHLNKLIARLLFTTGISFVVLVVIYFLAGFSGFLSRADIYEEGPTPAPTAVSAVTTATPATEAIPSPPSPSATPVFTYPIEETTPTPLATQKVTQPTPTPTKATLSQPASPSPTAPTKVVTSPAPTGMPTSGVSATPTPKVATLGASKKVLVGDTDGDGKVTASDLNNAVDKFIRQNATPTSTELERLDANSDGKIDYEDVVQIVSLAVNSGKVYPATALDWIAKPVASGDLDGDGYISFADVSLCLSYTSGSASPSNDIIIRGDFNENKKVDASDCTIILRIASESKEINPEFATQNARKGSGDFNGNGTLEVSEAERITKIAAGVEKVTQAEKEIADINNDGKVTAQDGTIAMIVAKSEKGDVNLNGKIDCADFEKIMRIGLGLDTDYSVVENLGDLNNDQKINVTDAMIVLKALKGRCSENGVVKGDINGDGQINVEDLKLGVQGVTGTVKIEGDALKRADMDGDATFTRKDLNAIQQIVYNNQRVSIEPGAPKSGDANRDGVVTQEDVNLAKEALAGKEISQEVRAAIDMNGDGQITVLDVTLIQNKAASQTVTSQPSASQPSTSYTLGDLNGDKKVTVAEGTLVLRVAIGLTSFSSEEQRKRADINGDGKITVDDALKIIRTAIGMESVQTKTEGQTGVQLTKTIAGDVNKDGKLDPKDVTLIAQYIQTPPKDKTDFALADLNNDGVINSTDVEILLNIVTGKSKPEPEKTITPTPGSTTVVQTLVKGDVNGDGRVDREDVSLVTKMATGLLKPTDNQLKAGDMDGDHKITIKDALLIQERILKEYRLGDVNGDGKVDGEDIKLALLIATGKAQADNQQLKAADINKDGKITLSDVMAIQKMAIANLPSVTQTAATKVTTSVTTSPQASPSTKQLTTQQKTIKAVQKGLTNAGSNILSILLLSFMISVAVSGIWWALSKK